MTGIEAADDGSVMRGLKERFVRNVDFHSLFCLFFVVDFVVLIFSFACVFG